MKTLVSLLCSALLILCDSACAMSRCRVAVDPVTASTVNDGDATGMVQGCGNQPIVGFTYCRMQEGQSSNQMIHFIGLPSKCDQKEACVFIKVFNNQGQVAWGGSIEKGKTQVAIDWSTLVSSPTFQVGHRGFWTWNETVYWKDTDGKERISTAQGDIILHVYRAGYIPLAQVESDSAFVWSWISGNCTFKVTSGLRAFIKCGRP